MRRLWLLTFIVVLAAGQAAVGMRASRTASVTGDEPFYLLTAQSLVSDGDLDLRDEYADPSQMDRFWDGTIPLWKQMEPAPDGRLIAPHEPGLPLLISPAYAAGGLRGVQRFLVLLWAAAMATAAVLAARLGTPAAASAVAAVAVGVGAPGIVYASQVYPEGPAALGVGLALVIALGKSARPVLFAALLITLAWLGMKYVPVAGIVGVAWAWRFREDRRALALAAAMAAVAGGHYLWWHVETFGGLTAYSSNVVYAGEGSAAIVGEHLEFRDRSYRLYGLFLDARFGLLRWLPVSALAVFGVRRATVLQTGVIAAAVAMATFVSVTMMGWWFPGRMLVVALPALAVLVAGGLSRLPKTGLALAAWSVAIGVAVAIGARTGEIRLAVDPFELGFPLAPAFLFPDFRSFGAEQIAKSAAWLGVLGVAAVAAGRRLGRGGEASPSRR